MRTRDGERGQAAVLASLCLFTMVVFIAMATNFGSLASDRIRIQNAADAAAVAGAYTQAGRMNQIALVNEKIAKLAKGCRRILSRHAWTQCRREWVPGSLVDALPIDLPIPLPADSPREPVCGGYNAGIGSASVDPDAEALIDWCGRNLTLLRAKILSINGYQQNYAFGVGGVRRAALLTADKNFFKSDNLAIAERHSYIYDTVQSPRSQTHSPTWRENRGTALPDSVPRFTQPADPDAFAPSTESPSMVDLDSAWSTFNYWVYWCDAESDGNSQCNFRDRPRARSPHAIRGRSLQTWMGRRTYSAAGSNTTYNLYFPIKIFGTPLKQFFDIPGRGYFGASDNGGSDELTAYAAAKPYNGQLGPNKLLGDEYFGANHIPMSAPGTGGVINPSPLWPEVYGADAVDELITAGHFRGRYRARIMGLAETPMSKPGTSRLSSPVKLIAEAIDTNREPGRSDNLPSPHSIESQLLH